jgi:hypothetical protein
MASTESCPAEHWGYDNEGSPDPADETSRRSGVGPEVAMQG